MFWRYDTAGIITGTFPIQPRTSLPRRTESYPLGLPFWIDQHDLSVDCQQSHTLHIFRRGYESPRSVSRNSAASCTLACTQPNHLSLALFQFKRIYLSCQSKLWWLPQVPTLLSLRYERSAFAERLESRDWPGGEELNFHSGFQRPTSCR